MTMPLKTTAWDASKHLDSDEAVAAFLEAAFEIGDPKVMTAAIGEVAKSRGMTEIARKSGLSRESLYRALSNDGNPAMGTVLKVLQALGMKLSVTAAEQASDADKALEPPVNNAA